MSKNQKKIDKTSNSYRQGYTDGRDYAIYQQKTNANLSTVVSNQNDAKVSFAPEKLSPQPNYSSVAVDIPQEHPVVIDQVAAKEKSKLQGINIALYVASILLVGGIWLFVNMAPLPAMFKYTFLWFVVIVFYLTGFTLKDRLPILKPAAVAFVCTALAILPFTGFLMFDLIIQDATVCWLVTSMVAFVAYIYASVRLNSQTLVYLSITSFISIASASVSTLGVALLWYAIVVILIGAICTLAVKVWSNIIPELYKKPLMNSGQIIVPATIIISLMASMGLSLVDYVIIFGISTIYYFANALSLKLGNNNRSTFLFITRLLGSITGLILSYHISKSWLFVSYTFFGIGLLQFLVSTVMLPKEKRSAENQNEIWLWLGGAMTIIAMIFTADIVNWKEIFVVYLALIGIASVGSSIWLRRAEIYLFTLFSLLVIPTLELVLIPMLSWGMVTSIYLLFVGLTFGAKFLLRQENLKQVQSVMLNISIFSFILAMIGASLVGAPVYLQLIVWLFASAILYGYYLLEKEAAFVLIGNILFFVGIIQFTRLFKLESLEQFPLITWLSLIVFFLASLFVRKYGGKAVKIYNLMWISAVLAAGVMGFISMNEAPKASINGPQVYDEYTDYEIAPKPTYHEITPDPEIVHRRQASYMIASLAIFSVGLVFALQDYFAKKLKYIDVAAIMATIGLTAMVGTIEPNIHPLIYAYWWALVSGSLAYLYYYFQNKPHAKARLIIALLIMSIFTMCYALSGKIDYQVLFLIEHTVLVVIGLFVSYKLLTIWGAVGVSLALLWMLSGYSSILLSLTGLILLAIVIYVIIKNNNKKLGETENQTKQ